MSILQNHGTDNEAIDVDLYGRCFEGVFGEGAERENRRQALIKLKSVRDSWNIGAGEYIEYDIYGRGDPRIFGPLADEKVKKDARKKLRKKQKRKQENPGEKRRFLFPPNLFSNAFINCFRPTGTSETQTTETNGNRNWFGMRTKARVSRRQNAEGVQDESTASFRDTIVRPQDSPRGKASLSTPSPTPTAVQPPKVETTSGSPSLGTRAFPEQVIFDSHSVRATTILDREDDPEPLLGTPRRFKSKGHEEERAVVEVGMVERVIRSLSSTESNSAISKEIRIGGLISARSRSLSQALHDEITGSITKSDNFPRARDPLQANSSYLAAHSRSSSHEEKDLMLKPNLEDCSLLPVNANSKEPLASTASTNWVLCD